MEQLNQYVELLARGAYASEAAVGLGAFNLVLLLIVLARQGKR